MDISGIGSTILDGRTKGIPGTAAPFLLAEIGKQRWNVLREDLPMPLLVLKRSNLDHNAAAFNDYLQEFGLSLAPHGKTTMAPQIFAEQRASGAWALTAATVNQVQVMRHYGINRIVLANQLLGRAHIRTVAAEINGDPGFQFYCFVDSRAQLDNMARHLDGTTLDHPIGLLVEIGVMGGRTGVRSKAEALALAEALAGADPKHFRFSGLGTFEGVAPGLKQSVDPVTALADMVVEIARELPRSLYSGLDEFILTGGGSSYFDLIADRFKTLELSVPVRVLLRSGCYVTNDHGGYRASQDAAKADPNRHWKAELRPALEAWSYVQSIPEPDLAFLSMGKRDIPYDAGLPIPFTRYRSGRGFLPVGSCEVFATNDQHAYVRIGPDADWQVGDLVGSGLSHPCTAFDKWRFIPVVDDSYDVIEGVLTFF